MDITTCTIFAIFVLIIFILCGIFYNYFVKQNESTLLTLVVFILSLSTTFTLVLFIPIDIYLVSNGNLEISNLEISQKLISRFYNSMFWTLIFEAYILVPFSYFYLKNKKSYKNEFDDNLEVCENVFESLKKTIYFIFFLVAVSIIGLIYRPGHKIPMEKGKELDYISDLFDVKHTGESAILFLMGCVVFIGVSFWVSYTSYGLACLPIELLKQKNIEYDKKEIEYRFENLKEKEAMIKKKYNTLNEIKDDDRDEILKINNMKRLLSKYNYKLQEIEKISESWVSYIIGIALTFRILTGLIFLTFSSIIFVSLLASITDKYFNSICAYKCGFVLDQINTLYNIVDSSLIFFSKYFPLDILVLASLALYIFCCSVYGIINVGIRIFFIPLYKLKPKKTSPETMLVFSFVLIHIILVLIMSLLTIAPNYVTYGIQNIKIDDEIGYIKCSLKTDKHICKMSVLSRFFNKIFFGIPYFANSYFFSNWFFILMYTLSLLYTICFKKSSYLDRLNDPNLSSENLDEKMNLLPMEKLT
ncbi:hypothetical protein YYC_00413 [Plasmodium yoelii 17X]|nr:LMBR1 domain-containing protein, putative [Plasmodium yoelii]ETB62723.1 hypothetical protein YYC_00413 [Plasmodium yoelii 17X]VTZ80942.1 LMBR1 domain-containing protein, putative [Plasmodium yoelii]|eukprot:XP_022813717.1 LMBR1 domain-containing protein, putative [Plasmodium yoelii]